MVLNKIFFQPQVKQSVITSDKHGMYELAVEFANDLRLRILRNHEIFEKFQTLIELEPSAQPSSQN